MSKDDLVRISSYQLGSVEDWIRLYGYKNKFLKDRGFKEVDPFTFYRDLFPEGSLQKKGEHLDENHSIKGNIIGIQISKAKKRSKSFIITDDLEGIKYVTDVSFGLIAPVNYFGKNRISKNARFLFAFVIDLDYVRENNIRDLLFQIKNKLLPNPTYIVNSGRGLHLYYFLDEPLPLYRHYQKTLTQFKELLIDRIWNDYTSSKKEKDMTGVLQGFRTVGSWSKLGKEYPVRAFKVGKRTNLEELKASIPFCKFDVSLKFPQKDKKKSKKLEYYKKNFPDWYERRIINKEPARERKWIVKRALYDWWKMKIIEKISAGHRYFGIMALAIYAKKCGISYEELEKDAFGFLEILDNRTEEEDNHFEIDDIVAALNCYHDNYFTFPRDTIAKLTNIDIPKNKRNYQKQKDHLEEARMIRDLRMKRQGKDWREGNGRPKGSGTKENQVKEWRKNNPDGKKAQCIRDTGLSKMTVYKWWNQ